VSRSAIQASRSPPSTAATMSAYSNPDLLRRQRR
jgi:hypothetical protein